MQTSRSDCVRVVAGVSSLSLLVVCMVISFAKPLVAQSAPGPLLAVTFHKGTNAYLYYFNGSAMGSPEHLMGSKHADEANIHELRGMVVTTPGTVLLVNAYKKDSKIVQYQGYCKSDKTIPSHGGNITIFSRDSLSHPYAIILSPAGDSYFVTNQDSSNVVRIDRVTGSTSIVPLPEISQPRGLAFDSLGRLWISMDTLNLVNVYDNVTWQIVASIPIHQPIFISFDPQRQWMLITNSHSTETLLYAINPSSFEIVKVFSNPNFQHGTGIASYQGQWFVLSQNTNMLFSIDLDQGTMTELGNVDANGGSPEGLAVLWC